MILEAEPGSRRGVGGGPLPGLSPSRSVPSASAAYVGQ